MVGLHFHVGSQITDMTVFKSLCVKVNEWKNWFEERGTQIRVLNVGGGLGIDYKTRMGIQFPILKPILIFSTASWSVQHSKKCTLNWDGLWLRNAEAW